MDNSPNKACDLSITLDRTDCLALMQLGLEAEHHVAIDLSPMDLKVGQSPDGRIFLQMVVEMPKIVKEKTVLLPGQPASPLGDAVAITPRIRMVLRRESLNPKGEQILHQYVKTVFGEE